MRHSAIILVVGLLLASCAPDQAKRIVQAAGDARDISECTDFQAAKNVLHARLEELSDEDLRRLAEINADGQTLCTLSISQLTAEVKAMAERLP